ncbi:MAG: hypothetical protein WAW88_00330 [Nocardioides sp.]
MNALTTVQHLVGQLPFDVPDPGPGTQPPGFAQFTTVLGWAKWIALGVCVLALIITGAAMAIGSRRGDGGEHLGRLGYIMGGVIIISAAVALVGFLQT